MRAACRRSCRVARVRPGRERAASRARSSTRAESWEQAAGGGSVAAVQLAQLADSVDFFTALGSDERGERARVELEARGITVHASGGRRAAATAASSTSTTRASARSRRSAASSIRGATTSALPWHELARCDAVYFCAGDADALLLARRARVLVATARELSTLRQASVELDALVSSGKDEAERYQPGQLDPEPRLVVTTSGALGGWAQPGGPYSAAPLPPDPADAYGVGRLLRCGSCIRAGGRASRGSTRSTSPRAAAPGPSRDPASTRRRFRCRNTTARIPAACGAKGLRSG